MSLRFWLSRRLAKATPSLEEPSLEDLCDPFHTFLTPWAPSIAGSGIASAVCSLAYSFISYRTRGCFLLFFSSSISRVSRLFSFIRLESESLLIRRFSRKSSLSATYSSSYFKRSLSEFVLISSIAYCLLIGRGLAGFNFGGLVTDCPAKL